MEIQEGVCTKSMLGRSCEPIRVHGMREQIAQIGGVGEDGGFGVENRQGILLITLYRSLMSKNHHRKAFFYNFCLFQALQW
jgi:hypothetical protein